MTATELYDALKSAGVHDGIARETARAWTAEMRLAILDARLSALMAGALGFAALVLALQWVLGR